MCGIAGLIDRTGPDEAELVRTARAMGEAIAHRGPDGDGLWVDAEAGAAFAHRRLAILGLGPEGAQPMVSGDGRWVICYNGEVYNFRSLKEHAALADVAWRGHSDTEVIVESIARRGLEATLAEMNGMFAFALFDRRDRRLHLVRDRLGIKPLYFRADRDRVLFGSELKALRAAGGSFEIDAEALASYLRLAYVPDDRSIFTGVGKLRPGEVLSIGPDGALERRLFWSASEAAEAGLADPFEGSDAEAEEALHHLLTDAVRSQLISEVPLGVFLSGGIDSATIAALATASSDRVRTFSIGFPDLGFDEAPHAEAVARHLGTEHTTLTVTPGEALEVVPQLPEMYDEPFADSSQIPTHLVAKLSRGAVTVALSGDGGDELFAGYTRHVFAAERWPALSRLACVGPSCARGHARAAAAPAARRSLCAGARPADASRPEGREALPHDRSRPRRALPPTGEPDPGPVRSPGRT
jgi:asparagine synthase (glutamine-hydrolysing)